jgi:hypothetical protein
LNPTRFPTIHPPLSLRRELPASPTGVEKRPKIYSIEGPTRVSSRRNTENIDAEDQGQSINVSWRAPFLSLAVPTETSATELNYWDPPLTSRPLLLPLASLHATPTQPRRRHAWSHYCARISPSPPLPQSASASQQNREKFVPSLSPPLSAPQIDPHSPSPEHTRVSDNYKKGCVATPSSSLRWLTSFMSWSQGAFSFPSTSSSIPTSSSSSSSSSSPSSTFLFAPQAVKCVNIHTQ